MVLLLPGLLLGWFCCVFASVLWVVVVRFGFWMFWAGLADAAGCCSVCFGLIGVLFRFAV